MVEQTTEQDNEYLIMSIIPRFLGSFWSGSKWGSFNDAHRFPQKVRESATLPRGQRWINLR